MTIPKPRLDALTDGVFAVAMTLLVIDLRLPENFHPANAAELIARLTDLGHQVLVYIISFYVLGLCWFGAVRTAVRGEQVSERYTRWTLAYLLLITFVPFTTMVLGRYAMFPPAVWLYAANMILLSLVALRMVTIAAPGKALARDAQVGLVMLIVAALLTVAVSLIVPRWALLAYLVNLLDGPVKWVWVRREAKT